MNLINRALRPLGWMLIPRPPSAKMLHEHANVTEVHHPSRGGRTVDWMRRVADLAEDECPDTVMGPCEAVCARCGRDM